MDRGRLEAFSDGVFAVAITLLALDLAVPEPGREFIGHQLASHWPSFAAYVVSFLAVGIIWVNHHALVRNFAVVDRPMLFLNLLLLFFVVTIPFATVTVAAYLREGGADAALAAVIYQGVFLGMSMAFGGLLWWSIRHGHLAVPLTGTAARTALIRFTIGNLGYAAGIGIAYLSAPASLLVSLLVAVYYVFEHTPSSGPEPASHGTGQPGARGRLSRSAQWLSGGIDLRMNMILRCPVGSTTFARLREGRRIWVKQARRARS